MRMRRATTALKASGQKADKRMNDKKLSSVSIPLVSDRPSPLSPALLPSAAAAAAAVDAAAAAVITIS